MSGRTSRPLFIQKETIMKASNSKPGVVNSSLPRRFETDYAGAWKGHCITRENACDAAMRHVIRDGYTKATITDKHTKQVVARIRLSDDRKTATLTTEKPLRKIGY